MLLGHHETRRTDHGYEPGAPGLRAAERAVRRHRWDRDAVIRAGVELVAQWQRDEPGRVVPDELHAAAVFYPAGPIAPDVYANPCLVVADQAVFVHVDDDGTFVVNVEVEAHEAFPGDAVPVRFEVLGKPIVSFDDTGRRRVHPDPSDDLATTSPDTRPGPGPDWGSVAGSGRR